MHKRYSSSAPLNVKPFRNRRQGFTLIELLVTMVAVGILTAIAVPAYKSYVARSRVKGAQADLVALSLSMENAYQRTLTYTSGTYASTGAVVSAVNNVWNPAQSSTFAYTMTATSTTYTLVATGITTTMNSGCTLQLTNTGSGTITSGVNTQACGNIQSSTWP